MAKAKTKTKTKVAEPSIKFNDKEYLISALSDEAKAELQALQFAESEASRLKALLAVTQTAANAYKTSLIGKLPKED